MHDDAARPSLGAGLRLLEDSSAATLRGSRDTLQSGRATLRTARGQLQSTRRRLLAREEERQRRGVEGAQRAPQPS